MGLKDFLFGKTIEEIVDATDKLSHVSQETIGYAYGQEKSFDWSHYATVNQGSFGLYSSEFSAMQNRKTLATLYASEAVIRRPVDAIMRQFLGCKFKSQDMRLSERISCLDAGFWATVVIDLITVGDAFIWISEGALAFARLLPTDVELDEKNNCYIYHEKKFSKDNIAHIKMPNPLTNKAGLSPLYAAAMQVLSDKYSHEFITGFFLRGGAMAGVIETTEKNPDVLSRFKVILQQAAGSRRNMHADKILPAGFSFKPAPQTMDDIKILDLIRNNAREIAGLLGVPPVLMGDTDGQNYATATQQMMMFWEGTIVPLQKFICSGLNQCANMHTKVEFDNTGNKWLDDFDYRLNQDAKLAAILTINERRTRLDFDELESGADAIAQPAATSTFKAFGDEIFPEVSSAVRACFLKEFKQWENIYANGVLNSKNLNDLQRAISDRARLFVHSSLIPVLMPKIKSSWENGFSQVVGKTVDEVRNNKAQETKADETPEATASRETKEQKILKLALSEARAMEFMLGWVAESREGQFAGYSTTLTESLNKKLLDMQAAGKSAAQQAQWVRMNGFEEFYKGQAQVIVNTEYASSMSRADYKFMEDLADNSTKIRKKWSAVGDKYTRDTHRGMPLGIGGKTIEGYSKEVIDESFSSSFMLRYPHDELAPAGEVINCRCALIKEVVEW